MFVFKVNDTEYKVRFGYGVLCKTDLIDRMVEVYGSETKSGAHQIREMISLTAELLLAGLQKYHKEEFGYITESEKDSALDKVFSLIDDYEDENADGSDGEEKKDALQLFVGLQEELQKNGFLSRVQRVTEKRRQTEEKQ